MKDDIELPAHRELPPHVRDRMLVAVREGMDATPTRSVRTPLAIAAAAAVLVGGVAMVLGTGEDAPARLGPAAGTGDLDRCWDAVETSGRTAEYPGRAEWQVVATQSLHLTSLTTVRAAEKTVFCETSATSVAVSAPAVPGDPPVNGAMVTPNGTVIGFASDEVDAVTVDAESLDSGDPTRSHLVQGQGRHPSETEVHDGVFVTELAHHDVTGRDFTATLIREPAESGEDRTLDEVVLAVPDPLVYEVDRPVEGGAGAGEDQRALDDCLAGPGGDAGGAVVDAGTWRAGAVLDERLAASASGSKTRDGYDLSYRVAVNDHATAVCMAEPVWRFSAHPTRDELVSADQPLAVITSENHFPGLSLAGVADGDIARLELRYQDDTAEVAVQDGTFAAFLDSSGDEPVDTADVTVTAYDAQGVVLHDGTLPETPKK
ncbi:hypothetical protein B1813_10595 [Saccharomonospora piscinae]|uniref:Uncharacterized protein n=1 Tax=Saccharomonospora piscinae TaxID=687388 RepID=A0A1V9A692_SACPI|nr:hypothetical protein [Saccharomonospora piscinae]OQO92611.1 hypothetical protein B1813_10595 [Saccharomonospora piscinae]